jgi:hypothetical protein
MASVTFAFTFHILRISSMKSVNLKIFSASFLIIFLSPNNATSINMHIPLLFSRIMLTNLLLEIDQSVHTRCFHNMVTLASWLVSTDFRTFFASVRSVILPLFPWIMFKCSWAHTLSFPFIFLSFARIGHADAMCLSVSSSCFQSQHLLSVSVCNSFVHCYSVCNAWSCAAVISLSFYPFGSRIDSNS